MKCPTCNLDLVIADRQGVEIDYCPQCRGVWLDRGELDKIIDRAATWTRRDDDDDDDYPRPGNDPRYPTDPRSGSDPYYRKKKRKSLLGELFDFD